MIFPVSHGFNGGGVMAHKQLASRARRLSDYCCFALVLVLWLASLPAAAQDRDHERDRAAAKQALARGGVARSAGLVLARQKMEFAVLLGRVHIARRAAKIEGRR